MTPQRAGVERLARRFAQYDVTIYCNLRRPDEYLSSWHRQRLKFGAKLLPLSGAGLQEYLDSAHFQQAKMIEGWIKDHFPKARLVVRNFEEVKVSGGSVVDFIRNAGIAFPANLQMPKDQNPSVPSAFAEIGRRAILELNGPLAKEIIQWLVAARRRVPHPNDSEVEMYGAKNRAVISNRFAEVAASLDDLTGRNPFYPDLRDIGVSKALDDITAAEAVLPDLVADARQKSLEPSAIDWLATLDLRK